MSRSGTRDELVRLAELTREKRQLPMRAKGELESLRSVPWHVKSRQNPALVSDSFGSG